MMDNLVEVSAISEKIDCSIKDPVVIHDAAQWEVGQPVIISGNIETTMLGSLVLGQRLQSLSEIKGPTPTEHLLSLHLVILDELG